MAMKSFDKIWLYRLTYVFIGSVILAPLATLTFIGIAFNQKKGPSYLQSHFRWLLKGLGVSLALLLTLSFAMQIWEFAYSVAYWVFGDHVLAFLGSFAGPFVQLYTTFIGFSWLYFRIKQGWRQLGEEKEFATVQSANGSI